MFLSSRFLGKISVAKLTVTLSLITLYSTATQFLYINKWIIVMSVKYSEYWSVGQARTKQETSYCVTFYCFLSYPCNIFQLFIYIPTNCN